MQEGDGENGVWSTTVELTGYPLARKDSCKPSDRIGNLDRHGIVWAALPRPEAVAAQLIVTLVHMLQFTWDGMKLYR